MNLMDFPITVGLHRSRNFKRQMEKAHETDRIRIWRRLAQMDEEADYQGGGSAGQDGSSQDTSMSAILTASITVPQDSVTEIVDPLLGPVVIFNTIRSNPAPILAGTRFGAFLLGASADLPVYYPINGYAEFFRVQLIEGVPGMPGEQADDWLGGKWAAVGDSNFFFLLGAAPAAILPDVNVAGAPSNGMIGIAGFFNDGNTAEFWIWGVECQSLI